MADSRHLVATAAVGATTGELLRAPESPGCLSPTRARGPVAAAGGRSGTPRPTRWALPRGVIVLLAFAVLLGLVAAMGLAVARLATLLPSYSPQFNDLLDAAAARLDALAVGQDQISSALAGLDPNKVFAVLQVPAGPGRHGAVGPAVPGHRDPRPGSWTPRGSPAG